MSWFGKQLRALRKQRDWTRYRLSKLSGVSGEGIRKLERQGADPRLSTILKLAAALGVSPRELVPEGPADRARSGKKG
jgi:transcriptional regulator with XRE-family HTH domain